MLTIILKLFISYLIGSISGSLIIGKIRNVDIRTMGSGNAGGTNAFRTMGTAFAIGVIIIDVAKGYIPTKFIASYGALDSSLLPSDLLAILCGMMAIIGHVYPIYHNFKGGKGAGAGIGLVLAIYPFTMIVALCIWIFNLTITGWVGFGTILASISIATYSYIYPPENEYFLTISIAIALFIIYTHKSNIKRMIDGSENQFEKGCFSCS